MKLFEITGNGETIYMQAFSEREILDRLSQFCCYDMVFFEDDYTIKEINKEVEDVA